MAVSKLGPSFYLCLLTPLKAKDCSCSQCKMQWGLELYLTMRRRNAEVWTCGHTVTIDALGLAFVRLPVCQMTISMRLKVNISVEKAFIPSDRPGSTPLSW